MPLPTFTRGEVVLTRFPFTDLSGSAVRPALVVSPGLIGDDLILAGISSVVRGPISVMDLRVNAAHPEFGLTGLRLTSVIRLHKLVTVEYSLIIRRLGKLGPQLLQDADTLLAQAVGL